MRLRTLQIGLSNLCNLRCRFCIQNTGKFQALPHRVMGEDVFAAIRRGLQRGLRPDSISLFWNDEPLLHPRFDDCFSQLLEELAADRAGEIILSTNATLLQDHLTILANPSPLPVKIILSIDAASASRYQSMRGGNWQTMLAAVEELLRLRGCSPFPVLIYQFLLTSWNRQEIDLFHDLFGRLHRRYRRDELKMTLQRPDFSKDCVYIKCPFPWDEEKESALAREYFIQEARERGFIPAIGEAMEIARPRGEAICRLLFEELSVHPDGRVSPCCIDFDAEVCLGRLDAGTDLWQIHRSSVAERYREAMKQGKNEDLPPRCRYCRLPEGSILSQSGVQ